eukprot:TRINITY_DN32181_c0_g1_i2.p1 TRINITY_DN32181_c0_g1~~TRINITY_DN32181_c0_g1_i2.p1  ORF type:complete len:387 (+),score=52.72 TRINITY_DN32181_c0_g1_i2:68-1228(+)
MSRLYIAGKTAIHIFSMDLDTGALTEVADPVEQDTAGSFMALSADGNILYSIAKSSKGAAAFSIDKTSGHLSFINSVSCDLSGGAHIATTSDGSVGVVLTAAYGAGGVNVVKIRSDGGLQEVEPGTCKQHGAGSNVYQPAKGNEQEQAHPHSCFIDSSGKWALVSDLGQDKVYVYAIDVAAGKLTEHHVVNTAPGAGPRHMCFHPTNKWVYGINELDNTINVYEFSSSGTVVGKTLQTISTLPDGYNNRDHSNAKNANGEPASGPNRPEQTNATADIHITPDGRFVYGSNRGHDSIVYYAVGSDGLLKLENFTFVRGEHPRAFSIHPSGKWLLVANQDSNNVVVFKLDPSSGALTFSGTEVKVKSARCIKWHTEESSGQCSLCSII